MGSSLFLSIFTALLLLLSLFHISNPFPSNFTRPRLCPDDERSALLQFKDSFLIDPQASKTDPLAYPKVQSWKLKGGPSSDCCLWDGIECDGSTGRVIGLDLSSSYLYGSIDSNSSLFRLVHLRKLNLAINHFNYSLIPSSFGHLSELHYLNLSASFFSGQIPSNISDLSKLSSLTLSSNELLTLKKPDFKTLIRNLTSLEFLHLNLVNISSTVPDILENSSSLVSLLLRDCGLYGKFPSRILQLPKLEFLALSYNPNLNGHLPEIHSISPLRQLSLRYTSFSGEIPATIGNFNSLIELDLAFCNFSGQLPSSFGNITQLEVMYLPQNPFNAQNTSSLSWFGQLTKLIDLDLNIVNLYGSIPPFFANLTQLSYLYMHTNQLTGSIPSWLMNLTQLVVLELSDNQLQGEIPMSISKLHNLEMLDLGFNYFGGSLELDRSVLKLGKLTMLDLSYNSLSLSVSPSSNATFPKLSSISLASCNLSTVFLDFLRHQDKLQILDLSDNNIHGQIPKLFLNLSDTLEIVELSNNFLTGEISPLFCNLTSLYLLRVRDNNLSGILPSCLGDFSTIELLDIGRNKFHGPIPQAQKERCNLQMLAIDHNQLYGEVPRSWVNCSSLAFLDLGSNQISGVFPSWLGTLPNLRVLILRSNQLHGVLKGHSNVFEFQKLHIIDLSQNNFSGQLPSQYFLNWKEMKSGKGTQATYMEAITVTSQSTKSNVTYWNFYSMSMTNKGTELQYRKILDFFVAIDLSCNRFEGDIPKIIGDLKGLHLLNLSNNLLTGRIPSSLGNLTELESLDLSQNKLTGEIPQELVQLNFLSVFNVSHNHLTGAVPQGNQFDTFQNDSYEGNPNLCGKILQRKCTKSEASPPVSLSTEDVEDSDSLFGFGWKPVAIGYGCGFVIGLVIGHFVVTRKYDWVSETFRIRQQIWRRSSGQRRRHRI